MAGPSRDGGGPDLAVNAHSKERTPEMNVRAARRTIPALLLAGALLVACAEEPAEVASPDMEGEAISPVGPRCVAAEGDVAPSDDEVEARVPLVGFELVPGGDAEVGEQQALDAAETWRTEAGVGEGVQPVAGVHTVVAIDDPDLELEPDQAVWVVRYEGIDTPDVAQDVTRDQACAFVIVDGATGEMIVTQYTGYIP
jgi:hypothetical protein